MDNSGRFVRYKLFGPHSNLVAFTTTRQALDVPVPRFTGDVPAGFQHNRQLLAGALALEVDQLVFPRQTHTNCVVELHDIPSDEIAETDALVTDRAGICLCVQTADCVPVLLFDPVKKVVSAVHAGWRGTVKKIVTAAVEKMVADYATDPTNILAAIGPSIGPERYEVGNEVAEAAKEALPHPAKALFKNSRGKHHFDLWEANRQLLVDGGLPDSHIEILGECNFQHSEKYFSARREGIGTGRLVSGIMLK